MRYTMDKCRKLLVLLVFALGCVGCGIRNEIVSPTSSASPISTITIRQTGHFDPGLDRDFTVELAKPLDGSNRFAFEDSVVHIYERPLDSATSRDLLEQYTIHGFVITYGNATSVQFVFVDKKSGAKFDLQFNGLYYFKQ